MDEPSFEGLVGRALDSLLDSLPQQLADRLAEVVVVVEPQPPARSEGLLGLYHGVPLTKRRVRGRSSIARMPDVITIYQGSVERSCRGGDEHNEGGACIERLVREVLVREAARYFGVSNERLAELSGGRDHTKGVP